MNDAHDERVQVVRRLYDALLDGDAATLRELLHADVQVEATAGLPGGLGRTWYGSSDVRRRFWGRIAMEYDVTADVEEVQPLVDGRVLVLGTYRSRPQGGPRVDAAFAHLLTVEHGRLHRLVQITDTHRWHQMLPDDTDAP